MYCGKCDAYIPELPDIQSCVQCGVSIREARQSRLKEAVPMAEIVSEAPPQPNKGRFPVKIEGFERQALEVHVNSWTGPKLVVNGSPVPLKAAFRRTPLRRDDGREVQVAWMPQLFGLDIPRLMVDGKLINVVKPFKWYQWLVIALPMGLMAIGGFSGGFLGASASYANVRIMRSPFHSAVKFICCLGTLLTSILLYLAIVVLI